MKCLPERKRRVLCSNIAIIKEAADKIMAKHPTNSETYELAATVKRTVKEVRLQALAMEKRLYLYKETIEGLGFKRVRK